MHIKYQFAITFPRLWGPYTIFCQKVKLDQSKESFIYFLFRYKGKVYDPIFTIDVSPLIGKAWRNYFQDTPVQFITQHKGRTFGYILAEELPSAFLKPDKSDYDYVQYGRQIHILKRLVRQVPTVLKTFHF
jgi:hypothetical protein